MVISENKKKKLTRYAFITNMTAFVRALLKHPAGAKVSESLRGWGIDEKCALKMLLRKVGDDEPILYKKARIVTGDDGTDRFMISYTLPKRDYKKALRNLYIDEFENNIIDSEDDAETTLNEEGEAMAGATSAASSGFFVGPLTKQPVKRKSIYMTEEQLEQIKTLTGNIRS